jgi:uncharacterized protein with FMN-binding domain
LSNLGLTFAFSVAMAAGGMPANFVAIAAEAPPPFQAGAAPLGLVPVAVSYKDGSYTGPAVDAYWGVVQVQAVVQNGQIASLSVLHYPSDRRESLRISQQALPLLRSEVVKAQTARVNIISGATLTSQAFMRSLDAALTQAGGSPSLQEKPGAPSKVGGNSIGI